MVCTRSCLRILGLVVPGGCRGAFLLVDRGRLRRFLTFEFVIVWRVVVGILYLQAQLFL